MMLAKPIHPVQISTASRGAVAPANALQRRRPWPTRKELFPYALLVPSLLLICLVIAYPLLSAIGYSLSGGSLLKPGGFVGLKNFIDLFAAKDFYNSIEFSLVFAIGNVLGCYAIGLCLALIMNLDFPGRGACRVAFLLPWIVPGIVSIVCWRWMLADEHALVNQFLSLLGMDPIYFLSDERSAVFAVTMVKIWRSFPFMLLSLLAALQSIDRSLYEAAELDGASRWQGFRYVTMPQIKNLSVVLCMMMTIWSINDFETPFLLTQGGPAKATESMILLAYRYTFVRNNMGLGSAVSLVTLLFLMSLVILILHRQKERA
ncbi:carbohydrate ABC transporter permease [Verminephrobacter aporrectodeae]|uniref:carbohydrate ABC transporter permease n=1 Tax=Verminephrobacter aporrectodeae TaxID=1110389 RepID=UPI00023757C8|nr:sugar ABC transporter permease [Verminephrobacter aporrectodeae]